MNTAKMPWSNRIVTALSLIFLFMPIVSLVVFSFNQERLAHWTGFSLNWYAELAQDARLQEAAWRSLKIALAAASAAVVLGTVAGFALARMGRFRGRSAFASLATAPLVMPEVIMGTAMLFLFVALQTGLGCGIEAQDWSLHDIGCRLFGSRGVITIWIGHTTLAMAYVTVLVRSRLLEMDRALEEAAMDLGCPPFKVFFVITLPLIVPALAAGWLLSFTLSLDDYVLASFLSAPGSNTLPQNVYAAVRFGTSPKYNALATLFICGVSIITVLAIRMLLSAQARNRQLPPGDARGAAG